MRCKFCGSKAIYPYKNHEQAGAGRVIAGAIIAGPIGAVAGLAGKNVNGYRCSACGMFSEQPMDFIEEMSINSAVNSARNGDTLSYERYQAKYANLEFIPVRQVVKQESVRLLDENYAEDVELLPEAEPVDESIKHSYSPNQYVVGSPVFISNVTIKDDNGTDVLLLEVNNISGKTLRSVYLNIAVYDDVGDQISTSTFAFQGLSAATGEQLPQAKPFNLNTNVAYKVDVTCEKAAFTDDSVWRKEENPTIYSVPEKTELVPESFAQYKYLQVLLAKKGALRVGQKLYCPVVEETHRLCVCGNPAVNGSKCTACGLDETDLQEVMDYDVLIQCRKDVIVKTAKERTEALRTLCQQVQEDKYQEAIRLKKQDTQNSCAAAIKIFASMGDYKDAKKLCENCKERIESLQAQAEIDRKNGIYSTGIAHMNNFANGIPSFEKAIVEFKKISGWKDADAKIAVCQQKIEELKAQAEEERKEREKEAEIARAEAAARTKRNKIVAIIVGAVVCAVIAFLVILNTIIIPDGKYNDAITLMNAGKYTEAISAFDALNGYKDSASKIDECNTAITDIKYNNALALMEAGKYSEAISVFKVLDGYKDSTAKISECNTAILDSKYNDAIALMDAGKYTEAISAFEALRGHKDSVIKIAECNTAILDGKYNDAVALIDAGNIVEAYESLIALEGYKDSIEKANSIYVKYKAEKLKSAKVGDYVIFGAYEQDNNTSNGKEDIEWLVLEVKDGKALVISKYALDEKQYNTSHTDVTWETCSLRKWLNNSFINSTFSSGEKAMIPTVTVSADTGNATKDRVFLLSITEAKQYFSSDSARQCKPTDYADAIVYVDSSTNCCRWRLRSSSYSQSFAAYVDTDGDVVKDFESVASYIAIRPALWINIG